MITAELARRAEELAGAGEPFATATVVRVEHPTSVEVGSVALVRTDGTIEGFVGGVCAEQSVKAYSLIALQNGDPVLLRILPDPVAGAGPGERELAPEDVAAASQEVPTNEHGAVTVRNPCLSGGAIEVFIEPSPPAPRVLVVGETPIAAALARIGPELGLEVVPTDGHDPEPADGDLALVLAAHGRDELHALSRGLEARLPYVGLVASQRRGAGVLDELRAAGVDEQLLERIDVPAGIPIGSHGPGEVAISILARIVSVRRGASARPARAASSSPPPVAIDPICGMTVAAVASTPSVVRDGETFYFCGEGCRAAFTSEGEHARAAG
jgi:xanthine dehydrogenase accessory factor